MRILATNPDTIGDLVLRQPLYAALAEAGHELQLIVRPLLEPLVSLVAPGAAILPCSTDLYDPRLGVEDPRLDDVVEAARAFEPDLLLITPFQWTVLEERLARELPDVRRIAMSGRRFFDPGYGPPPPADEASVDPHHTVEVAEDVAELRKNELLAGAVLGRAARLGDPRVAAAPEHLRAAEAQLARIGFEPGQYWIACIGHNHATAVRNWRPQRWADALGAWARQHGRRFLLVGHESEMAIAAEVRERMGEQAGAAALWQGCGDGDLDVLLGLIAHSGGYVGRDTGPMHLAAAAQKPVLAVFGGGTWPRFLPAADVSVSITVGVPCTGCNWRCHLPESYCIGEVPVAEVLSAVEALEAGEVNERTVRVLAPTTELLTRIGREGATSARGHLIQLSVKRRELMEQTESLTEALERAARAGQLEAQHEALRAESNRRESILKQRLAAAENMFRTREAEMQRETGELRTRLEEFERRNAELQQRLTEIEQSQGAAYEERLAKLEAEWSAKMAAVQERSRQINEQFLRAQAEAADLAVKLQRATADQQMLTSLSRQQDQQIRTLKVHVNELLASRWRRYGQRLRLCMTMPWEDQYRNGTH